MKQTIFNKIFVGYPEYNFFNTLSSTEKIHYFFEIFDIELKRSGKDTLINGLAEFFNDISEEAEHGVEFDSYDVGDDKEVFEKFNEKELLNENIIVESNSLKAVKYMAHKFMDEGYILSRDNESEKIFKKNKVTRYLRVYRIIGQNEGLCYN